MFELRSKELLPWAGVLTLLSATGSFCGFQHGYCCFKVSLTKERKGKGTSQHMAGIHGIFQARILEWVAVSFSRGSSRPRDRTQVSRTAARLFTV